MSKLSLKSFFNPLITSWEDIETQLQFRKKTIDKSLTEMGLSQELMKEVYKKAETAEIAQYQIAVMNILVEEAQQKLHIQALRQFFWGVGLALVAVLLLICGCIVNGVYIGTSQATNAYLLASHIVLGVSTTSVLILAVVFMMQLSRAALHESTINFSRLHGLRFGRLYVYLFAGKLTYEQIEKAFGWTGMFPTGFELMRFGEIAAKHPSETAATEARKVLLRDT